MIDWLADGLSNYVSALFKHHLQMLDANVLNVSSKFRALTITVSSKCPLTSCSCSAVPCGWMLPMRRASIPGKIIVTLVGDSPRSLPSCPCPTLPWIPHPTPLPIFCHLPSVSHLPPWVQNGICKLSVQPQISCCYPLVGENMPTNHLLHKMHTGSYQNYLSVCWLAVCIHWNRMTRCFASQIILGTKNHDRQNFLSYLASWPGPWISSEKGFENYFSWMPYYRVTFVPNPRNFVPNVIKKLRCNWKLPGSHKIETSIFFCHFWGVTINPFTPELKKCILPTFQKAIVWVM